MKNQANRTITALKIVLISTFLAATSVVAPDGSASACDCAGPSAAATDLIASAPVAFVGRLDSTEEVDPGDSRYNVQYELIVEHAVKGVESGDRVVMFGDSADDTSCGTTELDSAQELHVILTEDRSGRFVADSTPPCTELPTVDEMLAADLTLPETSPGPVEVVVVGRVGEAELIAYGADGSPVAYGDLPGPAGQPAVCPGSERLVQLEQGGSDEPAVLTIRDLATLEPIDHIDVVDAGDPTTPSQDVAASLVASAVLECRSSDAHDVAALLSWENSSDGQTTIVRILPDDAGGVSVTSHSRTSRARHDPSNDDVVGVKDGALVRIGTNAEDETVVAQLTDDTNLGAYLVEPDGNDGWWVGLGATDTEDGITERWQILALVSADGATEQWPLAPAPDFFTPVVLNGDRLDSYGYYVLLPAPGSSASGVSVPAISDEYIPEFDLGDGRVLLKEAAELIGSEGDATSLEYLLDAHHAVGVSDGPTVDPDSIRRELPVHVVSSRWINVDETPPDEAPAVDQQSEVVETGLNSPADTASSNRWRLGLGVVAVLAIGAAFAVFTRLRLRARDL